MVVRILADGAEPLLARSPVVGLRPVVAQLLQIGQRDALGGVGLRLWPPCGAEARPQVGNSPSVTTGVNGSIMGSSWRTIQGWLALIPAPAIT